MFLARAPFLKQISLIVSMALMFLLAGVAYDAAQLAGGQTIPVHV